MLNLDIIYLKLFSVWFLVLTALNAEPLLRFSKTDYYFENIQINNNEQIKIEIINDTGNSIDKFQIMTSCGCLQIKQENLPAKLAEGNNEIPINVEGGLLKDERKDYIVFLHYDENKVTSTKLHLQFKRTEGWQQSAGGSFFIGKIESWNHSKGKEIVFHFHSENPEDYDFSIIPHDENLSFQMRKKLVKPDLAEIVVTAQPNMNWYPGMNEGVFHICAIHKTTHNRMDAPANSVIGRLDCGIDFEKIKLKSNSSIVIPVPRDQITGVFGTHGKISFISREIGTDLTEIELDYAGQYSQKLIIELARNDKYYYFKVPNDDTAKNRISICKIQSYKDIYRIESRNSCEMEIISLEPNKVQIEKWANHMYRINGEGYLKITEKFDSFKFDKLYYIANDRISEFY